jgi:hypothetical protein
MSSILNAIELPLDIVDNIITANSYTIVSLYNKLTKNLTKNLKLVGGNKSNPNKKQRVDKNVLLEHIINNKLHYFNKTLYFKYFCNKSSNANDIIKNIDIVINNYVILSKYIKKIDILNKNKNKDKILFNLETFISNNISENLLNKYMNIITKIYNITNYNEIPTFINLYIILKSCNYFPINTENFTYNNVISYFDVILTANSEYESATVVNSDIYLTTLIHSINYMCKPETKYIPLFRLSLGMGWSLIIGYDILINRMIGFLSGGSSNIEYEYNNIRITRYLSLNKLQRIQQYEYKIGKMNNNNIYKHITKYLDLFFLDLANLPNPFDFLDEHKLNILDN